MSAGSTVSPTPTTARARRAPACWSPRSPGSAGSAPSDASAVGVRLGGEDRWTGRSTRRRASGSRALVALLAGVGMQTGDWRACRPHYLFRIVRALRAVGLEYEARMIAAEAVARL